ncbi:hypothetical protein IAQ61_002416 [Plenodomus lingam]|uniref:uncharacterized protein n=1 Tax=Leptosphaeria maculans TaxID=5022 RepID=UPI00331C14E4|nr:hypothetical protein IAQ61_002416 [Plenodomus lingam]
MSCAWFMHPRCETLIVHSGSHSVMSRSQSKTGNAANSYRVHQQFVRGASACRFLGYLCHPRSILSSLLQTALQRRAHPQQATRKPCGESYGGHLQQ